jgi:uncharacterized protein (TIGR02266 family)
MTDFPHQTDDPRVKAQLQRIVRDIGLFVDRASAEEQQTLLGLLGHGDLLELLQTRSGPDRRRSPRKACSLAVNYTSWEGAFKGLMRNISAGGMFIQTDKPLAVGQEITTTLSVSNNREPIKITGQIVWRVPDGIGVKFTATDKDLEEMIDNL